MKSSKSLLTLGLALACAAIALSLSVCAQAQTFTSLYSFCTESGCPDGAGPFGTMVQGRDGDIYGITQSGGSSGSGTFFKFTTADALTTLYTFCPSSPCTDGATPFGGLVLATDGDFYGVTFEGGGTYGYGTVFKITAAGKLTVLHTFEGTDGEEPEAALVQADNGNFYGTTFRGGAYGEGTVFEITPSGTFRMLHSFCASSGCPDGSGPNGLTLAADGNLYGTTYTGGESSCKTSETNGTFFELTPTGTLTTLAVFCAPTGYLPDSALVQAANGNFYGTTLAGGDGSLVVYGTVYEMTSSGSITSLHSFCLETGCNDGKTPMALTLGTDGNFYGITSGGGANSGKGTVFEITPAGQLTTLHTFTSTNGNYTGGSSPDGPMLLHTNGTFYGSTGLGGKTASGTIFSLATGLGPFVKTIPTSGAAGKNVTILGTNLTGATAVSFDGTAATFKVVSATEITTTVPSGATSGTVTVTTSGGTKLSSNVAFQVP
jgi:uncharacterized repeat protein (TIGR03803 family)